MVPEIVIEIVEQFRKEVTLTHILSILGVSSSSYYRWKNQERRTQIYSDNETAVLALCKETKYLYGYQKITTLLKRKISISHNTVQRIMQKHQLNCRVRVKRYRN